MSPSTDRSHTMCSGNSGCFDASLDRDEPEQQHGASASATIVTGSVQEVVSAFENP